jgi:outer membrane protein OmpA-like peptidoglycan-associated protein
MNKKYYITESQMKKVISHVKGGNGDIIEEGWKEVVLGAAMLLGSNFGGNKVMAQKANDVINKTEVLQGIKSTLEDSSGIQKLSSYIRMSPDELTNYLEKNSERIEGKFNKAAKNSNITLSLDAKDVKGGRSSITSKVKQGYAVTGIEVSSDTIIEQGQVVYLQDTVELAYKNDEIFVTGQYQLKPETMNDINETITLIEEMGGVISKVNVEASTDKEPIKIGNEKLANNRVNSVLEVLKSLGINVEISVNTLPNQGPNIYSGNMTQQERESARQETSEFRYVKISFVVVVGEEVLKPEPLIKIVERIEVKFVKANTINSGGKHKITKSNKKKMSCKSAKPSGKYKGPATFCTYKQVK